MDMPPPPNTTAPNQSPITDHQSCHVTCAGVIHVLDGLLQPVIPGFDPFTQAQDQADGPLPGVTPPLGE
jgi:hypothetical protein